MHHPYIYPAICIVSVFIHLVLGTISDRRFGSFWSQFPLGLAGVVGGGYLTGRIARIGEGNQTLPKHTAHLIPGALH